MVDASGGPIPQGDPRWPAEGAPVPDVPGWALEAVPRPGPPLWLGLLLLGVGLVALVVGTFWGADTRSGTAAGSVVAAPGRASLDLTANHIYRVAIDDSTAEGERDAPTIRVTSPSGADVALVPAPQGSSLYLYDVATFVTAEAGSYLIEADDPPDGRPMRLVVGEPSTESAVGLGVFVLGGAMALAGIVVTIVGIVRRRSVRASWAAPSGADRLGP